MCDFETDYVYNYEKEDKIVTKDIKIIDPHNKNNVYFIEDNRITENLDIIPITEYDDLSNLKRLINPEHLYTMYLCSNELNYSSFLNERILNLMSNGKCTLPVINYIKCDLEKNKIIKFYDSDYTYDDNYVINGLFNSCETPKKFISWAGDVVNCKITTQYDLYISYINISNYNNNLKKINITIDLYYKNKHINNYNTLFNGSEENISINNFCDTIIVNSKDLSINKNFLNPNCYALNIIGRNSLQKNITYKLVEYKKNYQDCIVNNNKRIIAGGSIYRKKSLVKTKYKDEKKYNVRKDKHTRDFGKSS